MRQIWEVAACRVRADIKGLKWLPLTPTVTSKSHLVSRGRGSVTITDTTQNSLLLKQLEYRRSFLLAQRLTNHASLMLLQQLLQTLALHLQKPQCHSNRKVSENSTYLILLYRDACGLRTRKDSLYFGFSTIMEKDYLG